MARSVASAALGLGRVPKSALTILVLALNVVGYPLAAAMAQLFVFIGLNNRTVTVPFRFLVLSANIALLISMLRRSYSTTLPAFWICWSCFWLFYIGRLVIDSTMGINPLRLEPIEYFSFAIGVSFLPSLALARAGWALDDVRGPYLLLTLGALGAAVNCFIILMTYMNYEYAVLIASRFESQTLNATSLGHLGASIVILACWALAIAERAAFRLRVFYGFTVGLGLLCCLIGGSRAPVISLGLVGVLFAWSRPKIRPWIAGAFLLIAGLLGVTWLTGHSIVLIERFISSDAADADRRNILSEVMPLIEMYPLFGAGVDPLQTYPHNLIIESFLANGVLSGMLFITIFCISIYYAVSLIYASFKMAWLPALYIQYSFAALVSGNIHSSSTFWCLMAAAVSYYENGLESRKRGLKS